MSADALRGYIKRLRVERGVTQAEIAERIRMPLPTYKDWERGSTKDLKTPYMLRAVQFLRGSFEQIVGLSDAATVEDGANLARERVVALLAPTITETPSEAARINRLIDLLAQGVPPEEAARRVQREQEPPVLQ
ncbi:MAG: helix-turn-helix transcriptional regulator [Chloroflexales bacterium]